MKNFKLTYIAALSILLLLTACNKQLDLKPHQQIEQNQAILTSTDVQITLIGAYNRAGVADLYSGSIFLEADLLATQSVITWTGTYQELTQIVSQTIPNDNVFIADLWLAGYQVINQTNNVLANLDKVDAAEKDRVEGEAKFLRGMVYFDLVRLFGKAYNDGTPTTNLGVPIVLTPTKAIDASSQVARATVEDTYKQAIADLTDAKAKLPEDNSFFANKFAASAILARLYLQKGDYQNALTEANYVITTGPFELNSNYQDEFPNPAQVHVDNTPEDIFAIQVTPQQGTNSLNTYYASSDNSGRGDVVIRQAFLNSFEAGDERLNMYYLDGEDNRTSKFDNPYGNVHVVRLAEMYLIRAEGNLRRSSSIGASPASDINTIRERAGLDPLNTVDLAAIIAERRHELAFEGGFFLHDAKRLAQNVGALPYSSPKLVFPIPLREINANPNLKQNEGY
ncbi:RagB/SusD family nutrient uptake outer membrane protein [Mucilaginibacter aquariorum]|uniref:RagB/SusD family nutrient uptake outer membrane protein n=1 Tax=Mucilaginibacter aquariorum TaxID=2967225 RepID=A0ABT1T954_9SPHI|nr:RagB/SusD family nutrient uptake outer membrane protein [Mucilaginibacter aquariorum]MCQ6960503.1 RagB/SusD family nutrient uptake outer membrane protein [Mucilaginibacter aquariorum]